MKAINIVWETDNAEVSLPNEMNLPAGIDADDFDSINDYLSDETGFLVVGYDIEE